MHVCMYACMYVFTPSLLVECARETICHEVHVYMHTYHNTDTYIYIYIYIYTHTPGAIMHLFARLHIRKGNQPA
jgi:hypothetical protein